ncbi:MAG: hypothetical protein WC734_04135 [Patescibacteria group bacterium]|jgi:hypothetical protein
MRKYYSKLSKINKTIFLVLTIPIFVLVGSVVGLVLGMLVINLFPDKCTTVGITTVCGNTGELLGFSGYSLTAFVGVLIGAIAMFLWYGYLVFGWKKKQG